MMPPISKSRPLLQPENSQPPGLVNIDGEDRDWYNEKNPEADIYDGSNVVHKVQMIIQ